MAPRRRNTVLAVLEVVRRQWPSLGLGHLRALLYVAENPGLSLSELSELCGCTLATTSRTMRAMAGPDIEYSLPPSLGLVHLERPQGDLRLVSARLSAAGAALCQQIDLLIGTPETIMPAPYRPPPEPGEAAEARARRDSTPA